MEKAIRFLIYATPFSLLVIDYNLFFPFITGKHFVFRTIVELTLFLYIPYIILKESDVSWQYKIPEPFNYLSLIVVGLCLSATVSNLFGINPSRSFWSNYERMDGYLSIFHLTAYFLMCVTLLKTKKQWLELFQSFIIVGFLINLTILVHKMNIISLHNAGFIGNTAYAAIFNYFIMLMAIVHIVNTVAQKVRYFNILALIFSVYIQVAMISRADLLALFVFLACVSFVCIKRKPIVFVGFIVLFLSVMAFIGSNDKIAKTSFNDPTVRMRLLTWKMTYKGFLERPLLGYGQENFYAVHSKYFEPELFEIEKWIDNPHNAYLEWLNETGVIGLIVYLSIFGFAFFQLKRNNSFAERTILLGGLLGYMVHNIFMFDTLVSYLPFYVLLGYISHKGNK